MKHRQLKSKATAPEMQGKGRPSPQRSKYPSDVVKSATVDLGKGRIATTVRDANPTMLAAFAAAGAIVK